MRWLDATGSTAPDEFKVAVSLGHVPGWRALRVFGHNNDSGIGLEELWPIGTIKQLPLAASPASIVSTSALDSVAGTGARRVVVEGLDANYREVSETVTLNGTATVLTAQTFLRVNKLVCTLCGGSTNIGDITATVGGAVQAIVEAGGGESAQLAYTVPGGHLLVIDRYIVTAHPATPNADLEVRGQLRLYNAGSANAYESWRTISTLDVAEDVFAGSGALLIPERSDIRVLVSANSPGNRISASLAGYLVQKEFA